MFTGLITDVGTIERVRESRDGLTLFIASTYTELTDGESIAVDGVCLTVLSSEPRGFSVAAVGPTRSRTTVGTWTAGRRVNLERAMRADDRFGGHIVQGHVDAVGAVIAVDGSGDARLVAIQLPESLEPLLVLHGSIAVNGVSLTVNALPAPGTVQLMLIRHTLLHTNLGELAPGSRVNIEADVIGKYVHRLTAAYRSVGSADPSLRSG